MAALTVLALITAFGGPASADEELNAALRRKVQLEQQVAVARETTERYKSITNQYQAAVNQANQRIDQLARQQRAAQSEAEGLGFEIRIAEEQLQLVALQLEETRELVASLKGQRAEIDRQLERRKALYAEHLVAAYRQSRISPLEMLLSSTSLAEFASRVQSFIFIQRADRQLQTDIGALASIVSDRTREVAGKELEIAGLQDQVITQRTRLAAEKARYEELMRQAGESIVTQSGLRQSAASNRNAAQQNQNAAANETARLNRLLEEAEAAYEDLAARQAARSGLGAFNGSKVAMWPLRGPITSNYGPRWGGFHNGMDIASPMYTPIRAVSSGLVTTVGRPYVASGDTAVVVIIAHGNNFSTLYGHLDDRRWPTVTVGQKVSVGDIIGYIGMTGWTSGPHLHFMTIANGRAQDPRPYLP